MGRYQADDDYEDDPEEPDEADMDPDEGDEFAETVECPSCGRNVYDQADKCPACGANLSRENTRTHPRWVLWTTLMLLALIAYGWAKWGSWL